MRMSGTSTVVTGGASGLGRAAAVELLRGGATVVIADLVTSQGKQTAQEIGAQFVPADVTDPDSLAGAFDTAEERGPIRAVVHCAAWGGGRARILDNDTPSGNSPGFEDVLRVNLVGTYNVLRIAAARMARNEELLDGDRGAVVLTGSVAAFDGQIGQIAYIASKAGVHGMTLVAARDLATWQIRVNTIAPGVFETPMLGKLDDSVRRGLETSVVHPQRLGRPEEFGRLAVGVLENAYLNGQTIRLDGALHLAPT